MHVQNVETRCKSATPRCEFFQMSEKHEKQICAGKKVRQGVRPEGATSTTNQSQPTGLQVKVKQILGCESVNHLTELDVGNTFRF